MISFLVFVGLLLLAQIASSLIDLGNRERLLARFEPTRRERVARVVVEGSNVIDLSRVVDNGRTYMRAAGWIRFATVCAAVGFAAFMADWQVALTLLFTLVIILSSMDYRFLMELIGVSTIEEEPTRKSRVGRILAYAIKFISIYIALTVAVNGVQAFSGNRLAGLLLMAVGIVMLQFSHVVPQKIIQASRATSSTNRGFGVDSSDDSVLFLRSFKDDKIRIRSPFGLPGPAHPVLSFAHVRFEELVARLVSILELQLVAIGRPNERLPELGALRTYYPDSEWRDAVRTTAARSSAIILVAGRTDNLAWEIEHLREWNVLEKAIFLLPPEPSPELALDRLVRLTSALLPESSPPSGWDAASWIAVRVRFGALEFFVSDGRDWASYFTALAAHLGEIGGTVTNLDGSGLGNPATEGRVDVPKIARVRIVLAVRRATGSFESGDQAAAMQAFDEAEQTARESGVEGTIAWVNLIRASLLAEAGSEDAAWDTYREVADYARGGFKSFRGLPGSYWWRAYQLEIEALSELAAISANSPQRNPRETHIEYYEALERHKQFGDAAVPARLIAANETSRESAEMWFQRAQNAARNVGDIFESAAVEQAWGEYLLKHGEPEQALARLEEATRLYNQQEDSRYLPDVEKLKDRARIAGFRFNSTTYRFSAATREWLSLATNLAIERGDANVSPPHFLLTLQKYPQFAASVGINEDLFTHELRQMAEDFSNLPSQAEISTGYDRSLSDQTKSLLMSEMQRHPKSHEITARDLMQGLRDTFPKEIRRRDRSAPAETASVTPTVSAARPPEEPVQPTAISASTNANPVLDEEAKQWDLATSWDLGWPKSPYPKKPEIRPDGLSDDKPMSPRLRNMVQTLTVAFYSIPVARVRAFFLHSLTRWLFSRGYEGAAISVQFLESEALILSRRFDDAEQLLREMIRRDIPGWITFADHPFTCHEMRDKFLESLSELVWVKGAFDERVEIEKQRLASSSMIRDPHASHLLKTSVAFALTQAGRHEEAMDLFEEVTTDQWPPPNIFLMYAANALEVGNTELAERMIAQAESRAEQNYAGAIGLKGDLKRAMGDMDGCMELYNSGLSQAIAMNDRFTEKIFRRRLASVRNREFANPAAD